MATNVKIVFGGASGVGKTSLLHRYITGTFTESMISTIGVEFMTQAMQGPHGPARVRYWDTAGAERYRHYSRGYLRGSAGCVLVYDVADRSSFEQLDETYNSIITNLPAESKSQYQFLVLGNKCDLPAVVSDEDGQKWCKGKGYTNCMHFQVSAKTNSGVKTAFDSFALRVLGGPLAPRSRAGARRMQPRHTRMAPVSATVPRRTLFAGDDGTPYFVTEGHDRVMAAAAAAAAAAGAATTHTVHAGAGEPSLPSSVTPPASRDPLLHWRAASKDSYDKKGRIGMTVNARGFTREAAKKAVAAATSEDGVTTFLTVKLGVKAGVDMFALGEVVGMIKTAHDAWYDTPMGHHARDSMGYKGDMKVKPVSGNDGRITLHFTFSFHAPNLVHSSDADMLSKLQGNFSVVMHTTLEDMLDAPSVADAFPAYGSVEVHADTLFKDEGERRVWEARLQQTILRDKNLEDLPTFVLLMLTTFQVEAPEMKWDVLRQTVERAFHTVTFRQLWLSVLKNMHSSHSKLAAGLVQTFRALEGIDEIFMVSSSMPGSLRVSFEGLDVFNIIPDVSEYEHATDPVPPPYMPPPDHIQLPPAMPGTSVATLVGSVSSKAKVSVRGPALGARLTVRSVSRADAATAIAEHTGQSRHAVESAPDIQFGVMCELGKQAGADPAAVMDLIHTAVAEEKARRAAFLTTPDGRHYREDLDIRQVHTATGDVVRCSGTFRAPGPAPDELAPMMNGGVGSLTVDVNTEEEFSRFLRMTSAFDSCVPRKATATARLEVSRAAFGEMTESTPRYDTTSRFWGWVLRVIPSLSVKLRVGYMDTWLATIRHVSPHSKFPAGIDMYKMIQSVVQGDASVQKMAWQSAEVLDSVRTVEVVCMQPPIVVRLELRGVELFKQGLVNPDKRVVAPPPVPTAAPAASDDVGSGGAAAGGAAKRILLLGTPGAGRKSLLQVMKGSAVTSFSEPVEVVHGGVQLRMEAGGDMEEFAGAVFVLDVTDSGGFGDVIARLSAIPNNIPTVVLANKVDMMPGADLESLTSLFSVVLDGKVTNRHVFLCSATRGSGHQSAFDVLCSKL